MKPFIIPAITCFALTTAGIAEAMPGKDSCRVTITAADLSEDMSVISTKNDELLVLFYGEKTDSTDLKVITAKKFVFRQGAMTHEFYLNAGDEYTNIIAYFIEIDSDKTIEQIDPVIRQYHSDILMLYNAADQTGLEKYFGDDDLLGVQSTVYKKISNCRNNFSVTGIHRADTFHFDINFN